MWWVWYNQLKGFKSRSLASWRRKMMFSLWSAVSACAQEVQSALPDNRPCGTRTLLSSYSLPVVVEALHLLPAPLQPYMPPGCQSQSLPLLLTVGPAILCSVTSMPDSMLASAISFITFCAMFSIRNHHA